MKIKIISTALLLLVMIIHANYLNDKFSGTYNGTVITSWEECGRSCHYQAQIKWENGKVKTIPVSSTFYYTKRKTVSVTLEPNLLFGPSGRGKAPIEHSTFLNILLTLIPMCLIITIFVASIIERFIFTDKPIKEQSS